MYNIFTGCNCQECYIDEWKKNVTRLYNKWVPIFFFHCKEYIHIFYFCLTTMCTYLSTFVHYMYTIMCLFWSTLFTIMCNISILGYFCSLQYVYYNVSTFIYYKECSTICLLLSTIMYNMSTCIHYYM